MDEHASHEATNEVTGELQPLLDAALSGNAEATAELIQRCRPYLLAVANQNIESGLRPKVAASDAVQETLIEAGRDLGGFRGTSEAELLGWLKRILQNNLIDARRRYQANKRQLDRELVLRSDESDSPHKPETASAIIGRDEEAARVRDAVSRLPDDYRTVIELRNWQLKSFEDIGTEMNRSAEAARKLWGRAIRQLQHELGDQTSDQRGAH